MPYDDMVVVFGPAGSGKNTLINRVLPQVPEYRLTRSVTTRAFRPSDDPGGTGFNSKYVYIKPEWFQEVIDLGGFLEYNDEYAGNAYGTLSPPSQYRPLLEIDLAGVKKILQLFPDARVVFVTVGDMTIEAKLSVLRKRMLARATRTGALLDPSDLEKRLQRAERELIEGPDLAHTVITNRDAKVAARRLFILHQS
jgi:guanylate kinase